jgi:2-iminobutanoate/2-iminopropanoate deaminase
MREMKIIETVGAPRAIGPYSQAIRYGDLLFTAGQIALDPETGEMVEGDVRAQADRVLRNLGAVLEAGGASFQSVLKATVFLRDMDDFVAMNDVYAGYFGDHRPPRSAVQVARLPKDARVEIELVAGVLRPS